MYKAMGLPANLSALDIYEYGEATDSQKFYSTRLSNGVVCCDNWGFEDGEGVSDMKSKIKGSEGLLTDCPYSDVYGQKMYKFMLTDGLDSNFIKGKTVLEVGCGRGKGAAYVAQNLAPGSYYGMDLNSARIE